MDKLPPGVRRWFGQWKFWDRLFAWTEAWLRKLWNWDPGPWPPKCRPALEMLETRWLPSTGVREYAIPTASSGSDNLTLGPDNLIWFAENSANNLANVNTSGTFGGPYAINTATYTQPFDITAGPDGNIWFTEQSVSGANAAVGMRKASDGSITDYQLNPAQAGGNSYITQGPDANLWFTLPNANAIVKMTTSGSSTVYTSGITASSGLAGITRGPDGNLWFTEQSANQIGRITPTGTVTEWAIPTTGSGPIRITQGPDGALWFTEGSASKIGRITTGGGITEWLTPTTSSGPRGITAGADGNIWFTEYNASKIGRLALDGTFAEWGVPVLTLSKGPNSITVGADKNIWFTETLANNIALFPWEEAGKPRSDDPIDSTFISYGPAWLSPQTGDARVQVKLDYEKHVPNVQDCGCVNDAWDKLLTEPTLQPMLVYNSTSVSNGTSLIVKPTLEVTLATDAQSSLPTSISAVLIWNNGTPQTAVSFGTGGHSAGDVYDLALQVNSAVTATGEYHWEIDLTITLPSDTISESITGNVPIVVNGPGASLGQFGRGWSVGGLDQLVTAAGGSGVLPGVIWVYGTGGARFFQSLGSGSFQSPPNDFGTLTQVGATYTYTAKDQTQWQFGSTGLLSKIVDAHGLTRTYSYDGSNRISTIAEPDSGVTTFNYDTHGNLSQIQEPGGRVVTVTIDSTSGNLTGIVYPDGSLRTFAYTGYALTNDQYGPLNTTLAYDANNTLTTVSLDSASANLAVKAAITKGLATSPAINASQAVGVLTNGLGRATTYSFDPAGRTMQLQTADGAAQTWTRDFAGQATTYQDARNNVTTYLFSYGSDKGDLLKTTFADGTTQAFQYNVTFHYLTQKTDQLGFLTTLSYDNTTGDILTIKNALGQVTSFTWSNGLKQSVTNALGKTANYQYDSARRLQVTVDELSNRTTLGYDAAGNLSTVQDANLHVTTSLFDAMRRVTTITYAHGANVTFAYNALGEVTDQTDQLGRHTSYAYDGHGWLTSTTQGAGTSLRRTVTNYYDAVGNVTGTRDGNANLTQYLFDPLNRATVTVDALGNRTTTLLDLAGNVTGSQDGNGNLTQFIFDGLNRQTVTVDALTKRTTSLLDLAGQVTGVLDPLNHLRTFLYDSLGRQTVTVMPTGERTTSLFDAAGRLTGTQDSAGNLTQFLFDDAGRQTGTLDALIKNTTTLYDVVGNVTGIQNPLGKLTTFVYDVLNRQIASVDPLGNRVTTLFDNFGNVTGTLDARNNLTQFQFDGLNRLTVTIDALQGRTTTLFDAQGNVTEVFDKRGNPTLYVVDALNRATVTVDAAGNRTTSLFDPAGNLTVVQDALSNRTTYLIDALNRATVTIDHLGNRVTSLFDVAGNLTVTQDARGNLTTFLLDASNRVTVTIDAGSNRTTNLFDAAGRVTGVLDGNNNLRQFVYDALDRQTVTVDGRGNRTTSLFDAAGNLTGVLDGRGNLTQYLLDAANRTTVTIDGAGDRTTMLLDANGNVTVVIDSNNNRTTYLFDGLNRSTVTIDANGYLTTQLLDGMGNLTGLQDPSALHNLTTFAYDGLNRKVGMTDPLGKVGTYLYNSVGLLTETVDRVGRKIDFQYDADNRMTTQIWKDSSGNPLETFTYSYDANGNELTAGKQSIGTYTMLYDALNRVTVVQELWAQSLTFSYDGVGNRTQVQDSFGGVLTSVYDAANNLATRLYADTTSVKLRVDVTYDGDNQMQTMTRYKDLTGSSNVAYTTYLYDAANRITSLIHRKGSDNSSLANYTYIYDPGSRVTTEVRNGVTVTYQYDPTNQLTADGTRTFSYDGAGNITNSGYSTGSANETTNDGLWTYSYDAEGNRIKKSKGASAETWTYGYDNKNEMIWAKHSASDGGSVDLEDDFKYDAWGNRVEKDYFPSGPSGSETITHFAVDGWKTGPQKSFVGNENFDVWADLDGNNNLLTRYLRGDVIDQLLARIDGTGQNATPYWYLHDRQGSIRDVSDNTGTIQDTVSYDGWGQIKGDTNINYRGRYAWTGREMEVEINLQYNRARYYDPVLLRWLSQDPLGFDAGDSNLYRYVSNQTLSQADPSGEEIRIYVANAFSLERGHITVAVYNLNTKGGLVPQNVVFFDGGGPEAKFHSALAWNTFCYLRSGGRGELPVVFDPSITPTKSPLINMGDQKKNPKGVEQVINILKAKPFFQQNRITPDAVDVAYVTYEGGRNRDFEGDINFRKDLGLDQKGISVAYQFHRLELIFDGGKEPELIPGGKSVRFVNVQKLRQIPIYGLIGPNSNTWARQLLRLAGREFDPGNAFVNTAPGWAFSNYVFKYGGEAYDANGNRLHDTNWTDSMGIRRAPNGLALEK